MSERYLTEGSRWGCVFRIAATLLRASRRHAEPSPTLTQTCPMPLPSQVELSEVWPEPLLPTWLHARSIGRTGLKALLGPLRPPQTWRYFPGTPGVAEQPPSHRLSQRTGWIPPGYKEHAGTRALHTYSPVPPH